MEVTNTGAFGMHRDGFWEVSCCVVYFRDTDGCEKRKQGSDDAGLTARLAGQQSVNEHQFNMGIN